MKPATERTFWRGPLQGIEAALADPNRTTQLSISGHLLGTWQLGRGAALVLGGDPDNGWDAIRLGTALQRAALLLRLRRPPGRGGPRTPQPLPVLQAANCCALGLALGDPRGGPLWEAFASLPDGAFADGDAWPRFVRELLQLRAGRRPQVGQRLGPYEVLLQLWTASPALLAQRLAEVLDHHLTRTRGAPGRTAEFEEPGLWLLPVEALAVRAVRAELGLPFAKVEHPMWFTNLVGTQPTGDWPADEVSTRLQAEADRRPTR